MKTIILKVSGEALGATEALKGIDIEKVNEIASEICELAETGVRLGVITGGGNIWRGRDAHLSGMDRTHADYMGMMATIMNAKALANGISQKGFKSVVLSSFETPISEKYTPDLGKKYLDEGYVIVFGGGIGLPFFSTDTTAALRCLELKADLLLMAKNGTDGVYDSDPRTNKNAKKYESIKFQEIIDKNLGVMDLTAATLCMQSNVTAVVFDMNVKGNIKKASTDYTIGTYITK